MSHDADDLPGLGRLVEVDRHATRFEEAWRAGRPIPVEAALDAAGPDLRGALLPELLELEWDLRRGRGEAPAAAEYADRFPALATWIRSRLGATDLAETLDQSAVADPSGVEGGRPELRHYALLERVGAGGLGEVYLARKRDRVDEHSLAVKLLRGACGAEAAARFLTEMSTMARLQHPHIVPILDSGRDGERLYLVMPFHAAGDLGRRLTEAGPLPPATAVEYAIAAAWALSYLHERGIVHRDLKPSNILLDDAADARFPLGRPWLADFGLVKLVADGATEEDGLLAGSVPYMAPEQAAGRVGEVGPRTDVWAVGVLLHEMLTGERPFRGPTASVVRDRILHAEPPPLGGRRLGPTRDLQRIVNHCLAKRPEDRYPTALALAEDLDAVQRGEPLVHAPPLGPAERLERWMRRCPAVGLRWAVVAVLLGNIWVNRIATGPRLEQGGAGPLDEAAMFWVDQGILVAWAVFSWLFQRGIDAGWPAKAVRAAWLATDTLALTALLWATRAVGTGLVVAYPVLIAATGLWLDAGVVLLATGFALAGYLVLVGSAAGLGRTVPYLYEQLHVCTGFVATGAAVSHLLRRLRALGRLQARGPRR
jgi:serine/threonine-protein kinase